MAAPASSLNPGDDELQTEYFDLNVLKGAVSFNTKPFKHRALVWIGFKKVLLFPFCWDWWLVRISPARFSAGCVLYMLQNVCAWMYVRGCLPQQPPPRNLTSSGWLNVQENHIVQVEILLPYVIAALFGIGYGSVVAAGGWEALQVQPNPNGPGGGGNSSCVDDGDGGGDGAGGSSQSGYRGGSTGRGGLVRTTSQISFAQQVCARDNRAEQEAQAHADDEYDDDDIDSSGPGSDTDDADANRHRGPTSPAVAITASPADRVPVSNRSQPRAGNSGDREHVTDAPANERRDGGDGGSDGNPTRASTTVDFETTPPRIPDALHVRLPAEGRGDVSRSSDDDGETRRCDGSGTGSGGPAGGLAMIHQASGDESTEPEDEEDEEEDGGGWGQVVVKPVKVARWDKQGRRSKTRLSLNQLRALIIERAESTPQRSTYKRAAKLGIFATVSLPVIFALCTLVAYAWMNASEADTDSNSVQKTGKNAFLGAPGKSGVVNGKDDLTGGSIGYGSPDSTFGANRIELETLALEALWRTGRALWALFMRVIKPQAGDGEAAAVAAISLLSVAFVALPTFRALEDAERTYQRRYMYSKYFCALTSSQRARKHRLPHFSLKNVANIRVWLALRAGKTWLRRHRRERRADAVVSSAFFLSLALLAAILAEAISREARFLSTLVHWELLVWCCFISFFLLRYLTLGSNTNNRYRDTSVLLTEQINVQLRILQNTFNKDSNRVTKRERLGVSSNVLKLATKLLKELDGPNKLSGLSMNPVLYNVTRVVLVSALSGVMSDTLGFSVKLWKVISFK